MAEVINISDKPRRFSIAGGPGSVARVVELDPGQRASGIPDTLLDPIQGAARSPLPSIVHQLTGGHVVPLDSAKARDYLASQGEPPARVSRAAGAKPRVKPATDDDGDIPEVTGN